MEDFADDLIISLPRLPVELFKADLKIRRRYSRFGHSGYISAKIDVKKRMSV